MKVIAAFHSNHSLLSFYTKSSIENTDSNDAAIKAWSSWIILYIKLYNSENYSYTGSSISRCRQISPVLLFVLENYRSLVPKKSAKKWQNRFFLWAITMSCVRLSSGRILGIELLDWNWGSRIPFRFFFPSFRQKRGRNTAIRNKLSFKF
jgi:hypothetical protein